MIPFIKVTACNENQGGVTKTLEYIMRTSEIRSITDISQLKKEEREGIPKDAMSLISLLTVPYPVYVTDTTEILWWRLHDA